MRSGECECASALVYGLGKPRLLCVGAESGFWQVEPRWDALFGGASARREVRPGGASAWREVRLSGGFGLA